MQCSKWVMAIFCIGLMSTQPAMAETPTIRSLLQGARMEQIAQLDLDDDQLAQWQSLQDQQRALRRSAYVELGQMLQTTQSALASADSDLPEISNAIEQSALDLWLEHQALKQKRLAFYQSLNADQQRMARKWLQQRVSGLQRLHGAIGLLLLE